MKVLIVVDMQKDFIDGSLGTKEAVAIVDNVKNKIAGFDGEVYFTRDTHQEDYLMTQEGSKLPVEHCIEGTDGWEIAEELREYVKNPPINKPTFGSGALAELLCRLNDKEEIDSIELIGLCTDICVISNAMLIKAFLPETPIYVDSSCCAGVTPESHDRALEAMKVCQINVI